MRGHLGDGGKESIPERGPAARAESVPGARGGGGPGTLEALKGDGAVVR